MSTFPTNNHQMISCNESFDHLTEAEMLEIVRERILLYAREMSGEQKSMKRVLDLWNEYMQLKNELDAQ